LQLLKEFDWIFNQTFFFNGKPWLIIGSAKLRGAGIKTDL